MLSRISGMNGSGDIPPCRCKVFSAARSFLSTTTSWDCLSCRSFSNWACNLGDTIDCESSAVAMLLVLRFSGSMAFSWASSSASSLDLVTPAMKCTKRSP